MRWEFLKYEIRKFSIQFSKKLARKRRTNYKHFEDKIIEIEKQKNWENDNFLLSEHDKYTKQLEEFSDYITRGIMIRSRATWYELGEKNNKYS